MASSIPFSHPHKLARPGGEPGRPTKAFGSYKFFGNYWIKRLLSLPTGTSMHNAVMPFVKLDTGILDSSLWVERPARDIFITALLMAEPREFLEPQEQLEVRSLTPTGYVIPPGWYGWVPSAGIGIVRQAMEEPDKGLDALEMLGKEDPESRSATFGGRRMVRTDGGFIILNYMEYRERDHTAAERQKRWRQKQKLKSITRNKHNVTSQQRNEITQAEAEADKRDVWTYNGDSTNNDS